MKKSDVSLLILLVFVISLSFLSLPNNLATGQEGSTPTPTSTPEATSEPTSMPETSTEPTATPTPDTNELPPTGSGDVTILTEPTATPEGTSTVALNEDFTGIWKARVNIPITSSSSSSTTGGVSSSSSTSSSSGDVSSSSSTSSSSSGGSARLFAHITEDIKGSNIITFKLCVRDGKLEGTVQQGGVFIRGVITSQNVISENEVEFTAESKDSRTARIRLRLTGERQFIGTFADGHTFESRKLNSRAGCLGSGKGPGGSGVTMGGPPTMGSPGMNDLGEPTTGNFGMGGPSMSGPGMSGRPGSGSTGGSMGNRPKGMSGMSGNPKSAPKPPTGMFGGEDWGNKPGNMLGGISSGSSTSGLPSSDGLITETGIPARN